MAATSPPISAFATTTAAGLFGVNTSGYTQGDAQADPTSRMWLVSGQLATTETLPLFGGLPVQELIGMAPNNQGLGNQIKRATAAAPNVSGWSVINQAYNGLITASSNAPMFSPGMTVHYYRTGSNARIPVACAPSLFSLDGGLTSQQVSWDYSANVLVPYSASASVSVTSMTAGTWANGATPVAIVAAAATTVQGVGDYVTISGATNTGTGGAAAVNGTFVVSAYTDSTHFSISVPGANGTVGTVAGTITIVQGSGALACKVLQIVQAPQGRVVSYDPVSGAANYVSGAVALIQI